VGKAPRSPAGSLYGRWIQHFRWRKLSMQPLIQLVGGNGSELLQDLADLPADVRRQQHIR
jgi:hypothetical protein